MAKYMSLMSFFNVYSVYILAYKLSYCNLVFVFGCANATILAYKISFWACCNLMFIPQK